MRTHPRILFLAHDSIEAGLAASLAYAILPATVEVSAAFLAQEPPDAADAAARDWGLHFVEPMPIARLDRNHFEREIALDGPAAGKSGPATVDWSNRIPSAEGDDTAWFDALVRLLEEYGRELEPAPAVGVIGGSGFYELPGLTDTREVSVRTPFGSPSEPYLLGMLEGTRLVFLPRHGKDHRYLPNEVNTRANIFGFKKLGVTRLISVSAVGSLQEEIRPGDLVFPRQFVDRTSHRPTTLFGQGLVAHVSLADPVCNGMADTLAATARKTAHRVHPHGTYLSMEGPQFSTRAESELYRRWGCDIIGMTNFPEARLAREAEICYATLALPTDYDCWRPETAHVEVDDVVRVLNENVDKARSVVAASIKHLDAAAPCECRRSLDAALVTNPAGLESRLRLQLYPVLARLLHERRA